MVSCLSVAIIYTKDQYNIYDKAFAEKRTLKSHFITHTGDKPYSSSFYVQAFKKNDGLTKYLRIRNIVS